MEKDTVVEHIGGCGRFQVVLVAMLYSQKLVSSWCTMFMSFGIHNPGITCADNDFLNASSWNSNTSFNYSFTTNTSSSNSSEEKDCKILDNCSKLKSEGSSTIVTEWGLVCDRAYIGPLIISVQMTGGLLGSLLAGQLADLKGRKFSLYSFVAFAAVTNLICSFSTSWQMFLVIRVFIGVALGGVIATSHPFPLEFVGGWWRSILTAIPDWNIGTATFAVCAWILQDWRHIHIATSVLSGLCFLTVFWVPESIRWLAVHDKVPQAKKVVDRICKMNKKPLPDVDFLVQIAKREKESNKKNSDYSYFHLLSRKLRHKSIVLVSLWLMMSISYYVIGFGITSLSGNFYLNLFLFSVAAMPVMIPIPFLANTVGRKWGTIAFMAPSALMCLAVVVVYFAASGTVRETCITAFAMVTYVCLDAGWMLSTIFIVELFPTAVRILGFGACSFGARFGSIIAPYLIPKGFDTLYISYLVMGILLLICCAIILTLPETKGKALKDAYGEADLEMTQIVGNGVDKDFEEQGSKNSADEKLMPVNTKQLSPHDV